MKTRIASGKLKAIKYEEDITGIPDDDDEAVASSDQQDSSDDDEPPSKRRRKSINTNRRIMGGPVNKETKGKVLEKTYRGKNVGKLSRLLDMPIDIFCEISKHLEPLDLLRLARSTRGFNQMLMSHGSKPIWRTARNSIPDLPDCPPDMSEPEYARLLFEKDCHICLSPRAMKVDWILRSRLCHRCRSSYIIKGTQLLKSIPDLTEQLLECIPCRRDRWAGNQYRRFEYFYSIRVEILMAKFRAAVPKGLSHDRTQVLEEEFFKQQKELVRVIIDHAASVQDWILSGKITKSIAGSNAATRRKTELHAKLRDLGYNEDDFPVSWDPEWQKIMEQPRDLTPRIWNTVRPRLEACIKRAKEQREETIRHGRKSNRRSELSMHISAILRARADRDPKLHMRLHDVLKLPTVEALVSENDYQEQITQDRWDAAKDQIEQEMDEFADKARMDLIKTVEASCEKITTQSDDADSKPYGRPILPAVLNVDFLLSPSTFFDCICGRQWRYPNILTHTHGWASSWRVEDFTFGVKMTLIAQAVFRSIRSEGRNEEEEIPAGRTFQCLRCDERISKPMDWVGLVKHFLVENDRYIPSSYISIMASKAVFHNDHDLSGAPASDTGSPLALVLTVEQDVAQRTKVRNFTSGSPLNSACGICLWPWGPRVTKQEVELHIKNKHLKDPPDASDIHEGRSLFH
ncbi:hypothetical protein K439DRAFT_1640951 [Ramaria rubella]|nr:hypothetical protein K439DRAFT_1640951 [Ramaria rubella]